MRTDTHRGMTTWGHTAVHTPRRPRQEAARPHLELGLPAAGRVRWMFPVGSRCCRPRKWTETLPLPGSRGDFRKSKRSAAMLKAAQWLPRAAGGDWSPGTDRGRRWPASSSSLPAGAPGSCRRPAWQLSFCLTHLGHSSHSLPLSPTHKCMHTHTHTRTPLPC